MLINSRGVDMDKLNISEASREGYAALNASNLALLTPYNELYPDTVHPVPTLETASIADILLVQESTAVVHFEDPGDKEHIDGTMMAVNYHNGHSEGHNLVVVQHPLQPDEGQWMLYNYPDDYTGPGADNRTFYKRPTLHGDPHNFEEMPTNPVKIREYLLHVGEADEAIVAFQALGYSFCDKLLPEAVYQEFQEFRATQTVEWDFSDEDGGSIIW